MYYGNIKTYDIADGPGVRVSLFVSGCRHHCKGCFNAETWNFDYGQPYTQETEDALIKDLAPDYIQVLSVLGGEPFEPENQPEVARLMKRVKETYPNKDIWCYSGYLYDVDMQPGGKVHTDVTDEILSYIDVLVDGEFVEELKDITLLFRGSRNQRLICLKDGKETADKYLNLFCKASDTAKQYVQAWLPIVAASQSVKGNASEREFLLSWVNVVDYE